MAKQFIERLIQKQSFLSRNFLALNQLLTESTYISKKREKNNRTLYGHV